MPKYPDPTLAFDSIHNPILEPPGQRTSAHYRALAFDQGGGGHEPVNQSQTNGRPSNESNEGGGGFLAQSLGATDDEDGDGEGGLIDTKTASALHDLAHQSGASEPDLAAFARVLAVLCGKNSNPLAGPTANDEEGGETEGGPKPFAACPSAAAGSPATRARRSCANSGWTGSNSTTWACKRRRDSRDRRRRHRRRWRRTLERAATWTRTSPPPSPARGAWGVVIDAGARMPRFQKLAPAPATSAPNGDSRALLAQAIHERDKARQSLDFAIEAERKAREQSFEARRVVDRLRAEAMEPPADDSAVLAAIHGDDVDALLALDRPRMDAARAIEHADEMARTWRGVADRAEESIEARTRAVDEAEKIVRKCAAAALASEIGLAEMLADAEIGAAWIVSQRALFLWICETLPNSADVERIRDFLSRPWLLAELSGEFKRDAGIAPFRAALDRLMSDANAPVDISPP